MAVTMPATTNRAAVASQYLQSPYLLLIVLPLRHVAIFSSSSNTGPSMPPKKTHQNPLSIMASFPTVQAEISSLGSRLSSMLCGEPSALHLRLQHVINNILSLNNLVGSLPKRVKNFLRIVGWRQRLNIPGQVQKHV